MEVVANGIWKYRYGIPEKHTPVSLRTTEIKKDSLQHIKSMGKSPILKEDISIKKTLRGVLIELPLKAEEQIYGFGLQLHSVNQTGRKKVIRVNSDPVADTGDSHAPVPFYVSNAGYGVFIDTLRYATFYVGSNLRKGKSETKKFDEKKIGTSEIELYGYQIAEGDRNVIVDVPFVEGIDIYLFEGPNMREAVQRYNLFSGGGVLPPAWGLGMWYRAYSAAEREDIERLAETFRNDHIPVDVFGIEPGWQTKAYSCSFIWDNNRFPEHEQMLKGLYDKQYRVNLWEHLFVHPTSPIYPPLKHLSGDYEVWEGLVPDLAMKEAKDIFANYHLEQFVEKGISGFKLDECDNSDFVHSSWSFPEVSQFPSGLDGEQMHNLLGNLYQETINQPFKQIGKRTLSQVRSSGALASSYPFVLYSDLYDHKVFVRGVVNAGFSGLLWVPEVRQASSSEDLIRRIQTVIFSPHALLNCWRIPNPPWMQVDREKNINGEFHENFEHIRDICKRLFEIRMSLIPYLYASFANYYFKGIPPFRALVMDYPNDPNTYDIDDQYMMGESIVVAPLITGETSRCVYLPKGNWRDFWTHEHYEGEKTYRITPDLERVPVFVKENTLLPLAKPVQYISDETVFALNVKVFGDAPEEMHLFEDDGISYDFEKGVYNKVSLSWDPKSNGTVHRTGNYSGKRYQIISWEKV
ncbi:TIM-barrel domain-containing protein [Halalkalibacter sp. APA_J-10(15)]|uniref:glycoside hydrolase family 31 protein n=1 Tax=Halalkalibacter sp. APA_J-10(15) TaxID=2933805 RepID=UPI001FF1DF99|nr:TIM-barrel domain-containing protein [Halalkalibacter sp. APA_J-10(15)]MCK0473665.1 DUF5110 domain-containing protein [Halalkalibacter sp. APA_J-10(15)]